MKPHQLSWKWLLLGLVAFLLVGLAIVPRQIGDSQQLRERVTAALSEWTGGEVTLIEPWSVRYFPPLSIRGGFAVHDTTRLPLVQSITAKDIKISLNVGHLLLGRLSIDGMRLNRPVITLKGGTAPSASPSEIANLLAGTTVSAMRLRGATINSATGQDVATKLEASFDATDGGGALAAFGSFDLRDETVRFVIDSGALTETETGPSAPFRLRLSGPIAATFRGTASVAGTFQLDGTMQAEIGDGRRFLKWAGIPVPDSQSLRGLSVTGPAHWNGSTLTVDGGSFTLDGNSAVGLLAVTMGERPRVEGTLDFERLVLGPYIGGTQDTSPAPQGALLDWPLLKYFDADLRVSAAQIATSAIKLGRGSFTVNAKEGVVAAEIGEIELCGGSATGRLGFDLSQAKIKASLVGSLADVDIDPCLKPLALDIPLKGVGTLKTDVTTEGETIDEIVRSLSGDLKIKAQNGAVPVDFAQLLTASTPLEGDGWSQKNLTPFETLDADCRLSAGHIWCQRFKMQTQRGLVSGAGDVDMGRQTLDWSLSVASLMAPLNAAQLETSPQVSIRGPLAQPMIRRADRPTLGEGSTQTSPSDAPVSPR
jgi:AsmA protein